MSGLCVTCEKHTDETNGTSARGLTKTFWFCNSCTEAQERDRARRDAEEEKQNEIDLAWYIREKEKREEAEKRMKEYMAGVY